MKKIIIIIFIFSAMTSCITGGIGIDSSGKVRGNIGLRTVGPVHGGVSVDTDGGVSGGVGVGF